MADVKSSVGERRLAGHRAGSGVEADLRPSSRTGPDAVVRRRICTFVRDQIALGKWAPGVRLPDRLWFRRRFHCTFTATQAAFDQLRREGFVQSRTRSGTIAADPPPFAGRYLILCRNISGERDIGDIAALKAAAKILETERDISFEFRDGGKELETTPEARAAILAELRAQRWAGAFLQPWSQIMADIGPVRLNNVPVCYQAGRIGVGARGFTGSHTARLFNPLVTSPTEDALERLLAICSNAGRHRVAIFDHQTEQGAFPIERAMAATRRHGLELGPVHYQALRLVGRRRGTRDAVCAILRAVLAPGREWQPDCIVLMDDHWIDPLEEVLFEQGAKAARGYFVACIGNAPLLPASRLDVHFAGLDHLATLRSFLDWCDAIHAGEKSPPPPCIATF